MDQKILRRAQGVRQLAEVRAALEQLCVVFYFWSNDRNLDYKIFWLFTHLSSGIMNICLSLRLMMNILAERKHL